MAKLSSTFNRKKDKVERLTITVFFCQNPRKLLDFRIIKRGGIYGAKEITCVQNFLFSPFLNFRCLLACTPPHVRRLKELH